MFRVIFAGVILSLFISGCATNNTWTNEPAPLAQKPAQKPTQMSAQMLPQIEPSVQDKKEVKVEDDLWERIRLGFDISDPNLAINDRHVNQLKANPAYVDRLLDRSSSYLFYIIEEVEARDMPSELALLPFVESAFNPKAVSPVKAAGMWQFMPATGKYFNLDQNIFRDERGDIIKSTRAALDYLQKLYDMFGDWQLALAAYNWGEGSVGRAIAKNKAANRQTDYWSLSMPNETKNYVPKLLAYKRIIEDPQKYGFKLPKVKNHPYFVSIPREQDIDVDKVIELSGITRNQFLALNPSYNGPVILKGFNQEILLPYGKAEIFKMNLNDNRAELTSWTVVKLDRTETVEHVATRLQTDPVQIREINKIPKGMKIRVGSTILIPKNEMHTTNVPLEIAQNPVLSLEREFAPVAVVMKCKGKKCVAVPSNLANYNPRDPNSGKVTTASNQGKSTPVKNGTSNTKSKSSKSTSQSKGTAASSTNKYTQSKSTSTKNSDKK
jgi:membrane-bound lytic murein transglycosylase D